MTGYAAAVYPLRIANPTLNDLLIREQDVGHGQTLPFLSDLDTCALRDLFLAQHVGKVGKGHFCVRQGRCRSWRFHC